MAPASSPPVASSPLVASSAPSNATPAWAWTLDEAAIRDDGGADGLAVGVDDKIASEYAYTTPNTAYARVLWEVKSTDSGSPPPLPCPAAGAGWIVPRQGPTPPVFIAHTMLAAVWLLRQSLPDAAVPETAWAQLTRAVASVDLSTPSPEANKTPPPAEEPPRSNKRARTLSAAAEPTDKAAEGGQAVATVSNHNRRAERTRKTQQVKAAERRRMKALGIVEPGSQAPVVERNAHRSIALQDGPTVAWIVKQPTGQGDFINTAKLPFATATTMLRCARSIGDETAMTHAAYFVQNWRRSGHPLLLDAARAHALVPAGPARTAFQITMDAITLSESMSATAGISYRWGMACMGQRYQEEIALIEAADETAGRRGGRRDGAGQVRTQAKKALWDKEKPSLTWAAFNARLKRSQRWLKAAETLGWGFLLLVSTANVTPNWVEQTLRTAEWDIWLQLVERENPAAVQASRDFDAWVGAEALQNGSIQDAAPLRLESRLASRIHEVPDSNDEGDSTSDSDGDSEGDDRPSDTAPRSPRWLKHGAIDHTTVLRALDLRDLFKFDVTEASED